MKKHSLYIIASISVVIIAVFALWLPKKETVDTEEQKQWIEEYLKKASQEQKSNTSNVETVSDFKCPEDYTSIEEYIEDTAKYIKNYQIKNPNTTEDEILEKRYDDLESHNCQKNNTEGENVRTIQEKDYSNLELYKNPENDPYMVGKAMIKDIDKDGSKEKVVRYNLRMADRIIQELYIYREINGEYKLIKTFSGDPYGFAKMINGDTIIVGRFLPIREQFQVQDGTFKNWDDFEQFEVSNYKWTETGEVEISKNIIQASSNKDLSEEIKNNFN